MTTTADLIAATERLLFSGSREERNYLAAGYTAGGTSLTLAYPAGNIQAGARIGIGLEMFIVKAVVDLTVTVAGAQEGSAAANHSTGDMVYVTPKFSPWSILAALNSELASLSSPANGLFRVATADLTYNASILGYDLGTSSFLGVYEAQFKLPGPSLYWPYVEEVDVKRDMLASDFPSGTALFLVGATQNQPIRVKYFAPFVPLATLADDVLAVAKLPATCHDIPPYGAADILVSASEARRNFVDAQGSSKRLEEVPVGAQRQAAAGFRLIHDRRVREEAQRLRQAYPKRRTW